ncbi:Glutamine--tRNA ligase [Candida viswanathii]|uniref:glutamine--tRNA ligase n=1 Tax=Candida viswanathii TaxID=5486 RepID=A0A367YHY5_9ASCO|nr:Glutamine--tRNA ligase [Candida viswanathii]
MSSAPVISEDELISLFSKAGFEDKKAKEIVKNKKVALALYNILDKNATGNDDKKLALLHQLAIHESKNGVVPNHDTSSTASAMAIKYLQSNDQEEISKYLDAIKPELESKRYSILAKVLGEVKKEPSLKWAPPQLFKPVWMKSFGQIGTKGRKRQRQEEREEAKGCQQTSCTKKTVFDEPENPCLQKPGEEPQMYPELLEEHRKFIKGKVLTRFPPEPNGFLHIGHSKAIMVNFGFAQYHDAEEEVYFNSIKEMVSWLGYKPWQITYSSDYFDQLYELAVQLIKCDKAYICHCTQRSQGIPWHNLREFGAMKDGKYGVGEATLRMKQDLESPSPQMWDLWKIYPTYDFTHCLVDSFENITHSLCTTEFVLSRESYEWLCDALHVYRPAQREYGRLNLTGTIMSKRKIAKLVNEGYVRGWDDPRLYTLEGIKRRGVPPGAILSFINTLGVTTATTNIQSIRFESAVRNYLDQTTPRLMMVLNPVEVVVDNVDEDFSVDVEIPFQPGKDEKVMGSRKLTFSKHFYIDASDAVPFNISFNSVETKDGKKIVHVNYDEGIKAKPRTYIHWVPKHLLIYNQLFKSENPSAHPEGYLKDIDPNSEEVLGNSVVEEHIKEVIARSPMNVEIPGSDFNIKESAGNNTTSDGALIINRIVSLKEDAAKN